jgi:VIT1/CCC1 family predicted Fe2+/Mn2+ transporter
VADLDLNCRVAKVEQKIEGLTQELHKELEDSRRRSDRIFTALDELKKESAKNKGFFGGIVFAVGAIFAVVAYVFGKG